METNQTPKQWYVGRTGNHQGLVCEEKTGKNIAVTYDKADAPLVALAPEMYECLVEAEDQSRMRRPIKKATWLKMISIIGRIRN